MPQPVEHAKKIDLVPTVSKRNGRRAAKVCIEQLLTQADASVRSELLQVLVEVEHRAAPPKRGPAECRRILLSGFHKELGAVQTAFDSPSKRRKAAASQDTSVSKDSVRTGTFSATCAGRPPARKKTP